MAEKLMCSNCGAPVTRTGTETSVACPHCQVVTEFPPVPAAVGASGARDRHDRRDDDDNGRFPSIVIIQAPAQQPVQQIIQRPIIVSGPGSSTTYVRRRSLASYLAGPIFFIIVFAVVGAYVRSRAAHAVAEAEKGVHEAEKSAHEAEKSAERAPEHKAAPAKH